MVFTASHDRTARLWDVATGQPVGSPMRHPGWVIGAALGPDGSTIVTGGMDGTARFWSVAKDSSAGPVIHHPGPVAGISLSQDGQRALSWGPGKAGLRLWRPTTGEILGPTLHHPGGITAAALSPDGHTLLTGSQGKVCLWEAVSGKPLFAPLPDSSGPLVQVVTFSNDGKVLLAGSCGTGEGGKLQLWDAATGRPLAKPIVLPRGSVAAAFSPDGQKIVTGTAGCDGRGESGQAEARLWDVSRGGPLGQPMLHQGAIDAVAFSPDGRLVATGSQDGTARLWDAATGDPIGKPLRHDKTVGAVCFSTDGKLLLTGSQDGTARLWDVALQQPNGPPLHQQGPIAAVAFHPQGQWVFTAGSDCTVRSWRVIEPISEEDQQVLPWVEMLTGVRLDPAGAAEGLKRNEWAHRRKQFANIQKPEIRGQ
jgi:WD40 repeat protein